MINHHSHRHHIVAMMDYDIFNYNSDGSLVWYHRPLVIICWFYWFWWIMINYHHHHGVAMMKDVTFSIIALMDLWFRVCWWESLRNQLLTDNCHYHNKSPFLIVIINIIMNFMIIIFIINFGLTDNCHYHN